jgi:hypothetical protein
MAATCELERRQGVELSGMLRDLFRSPKIAWAQLAGYWRLRAYRGSYDDEKAILLYYRDRELELRQAVGAASWLEMRRLPGVTNLTPFRSTSPSRVLSMMNSRQLAVSAQGQGRGVAARAAEAEARRRLVITAIALERYRVRHGSYPKALADLAPELLKSVPIDFVDGQPLRYRPRTDGQFVLYSVGLDCVDNGGAMRGARGGGRFPQPGAGSPAGWTYQSRGLGGYGWGGESLDLVWPCAASAAEIQAHEQEQQQIQQAAQQLASEEAAEMAKAREQERAQTMAQLEELYAGQQPGQVRDAVYQGKPLSKLLRNTRGGGTNQPTLAELLTLKQISTGQEPDIATFEVPVGYDILTNLVELHLLVDAAPDDQSAGEESDVAGCTRASNGNSLLAWNTTYSAPGRHFLQVLLQYANQSRRGRASEPIEVRGPLALFVSTNVCQFDPAYSGFGPGGAILYARLAESNATYTIELKTPAGVLIRTFTGATSNGLINVHWDLIDQQGRTYTNDSFHGVFNVTLTKSGRSQTLKGPEREL